MPDQSSRFLSFSKITLVTIYLVILAGAIVRSTGAGMGCPDWPKCFGKWVPPTDESQLPSDYHDIYKDRGYADTTFNVYHTWTEYINRLMGALLGVFVFVTFILSLKYRKSNPSITYLCTVEVLLIGFQGWLGALVVSSNLAPVKVTVHMLIALSIVALSIYIISKISNKPTPSLKNNYKQIKNVLILCLLFSIFQILIGTQVRERIDKISFSLDYEHRDTWISYIGTYFEIHRIFAIAIVLINFYLFRLMLKEENTLSSYIKIMISLIIGEILVGLVLSYFSLPSYAQPLHLLLASIVFGVQFYLFTKIVNVRNT